MDEKHRDLWREQLMDRVSALAPARCRLLLRWMASGDGARMGALDSAIESVGRADPRSEPAR